MQLLNLAIRPQRAQRELEYARAELAVSLKETAAREVDLQATHAAELKELRAAAAAERLQLLGEARRERVLSPPTVEGKQAHDGGKILYIRRGHLL